MDGQLATPTGSNVMTSAATRTGSTGESPTLRPSTYGHGNAARQAAKVCASCSRMGSTGDAGRTSPRACAFAQAPPTKGSLEDQALSMSVGDVR